MTAALVRSALLVGTVALASSAHAASPEDDYLAACDRALAAIAKLDTKDTAKSDALYEAAVKDLEDRLKVIVGPLEVAGFPKTGKLNLEALSEHDEGYGMLDGLVFGDSESARNVVVTTDGLFDRWLRANAHTTWNDATMPADVAGALQSEAFYSMADSTDSAVVAYGTLPLVAPPGAKFAYALLAARTQDDAPEAPDQMFVTLEHAGRVFVVNESLATRFPPIPVCKAEHATRVKKAEAVETKAYAAHGRGKEKLWDQAQALRTQADTLMRACFKDKARTQPAFATALKQAEEIVAAFTR